MLQIGKLGGFNFRYFSKSHIFTKGHILKYFIENPELKIYIPDDISPTYISREYSLSVNNNINNTNISLLI